MVIILNQCELGICWGWLKLPFFVAAVWAIFKSEKRSQPEEHKKAHLLMAAIGIYFIAGLICWSWGYQIDIGTTTIKANALFFQGFNPYEVALDVERNFVPLIELKQGELISSDLMGYKYLPFMFLFFSNGISYKLQVFLLCAISALLLYMITGRTETSALYLISPYVLWNYGILSVNDALPEMLLLLSFFLMLSKLYIASGVALGLAMASKVLPAPIYFLFICAKCLQEKNANLLNVVKYSLATALVVVMPFFLWNPQAFINNVITFTMIREVESTSIMFYILPKGLEWLTFALTAGVIAFCLAKKDLVKWYPACIIGMLTFAKLIAVNYMLWFMPWLAINLTGGVRDVQG